jgi:hypothetical protein
MQPSKQKKLPVLSNAISKPLLERLSQESACWQMPDQPARDWMVAKFRGT